MFPRRTSGHAAQRNLIYFMTRKWGQSPKKRLSFVLNVSTFEWFSKFFSLCFQMTLCLRRDWSLSCPGIDTWARTDKIFRVDRFIWIAVWWDGHVDHVVRSESRLLTDSYKHNSLSFKLSTRLQSHLCRDQSSPIVAPSVHLPWMKNAFFSSLKSKLPHFALIKVIYFELFICRARMHFRKWP